MNELHESIKHTRKVINGTLTFFVLLFSAGLAIKFVNYEPLVWPAVRAGIGLFVIYSLYKAKDWAKNFITVACTIIILGALIPGITQLVRQSWLPAIINLLTVVWAVYLIRFLNVGKDYEQL